MSHNLEHFIGRALPDNVREDYPEFALFVEKYFEYISRDLGEYDIAANLLDYADIDKTVEDFYVDFKSKYVPLLPEKFKASLSTIVKNANKFYQTKGTEESFKTFFRMVFDTTVNLYYPKQDMLRASGGKWIQPYYIYSTEQDYATLEYYFDKRIIGSVSNSTAYVEKINQITDPADANNKIWVISLVDRVGTFVATDVITVEGEITPSITLDPVDSIISGTGYWEGTDGFLSWNKYIQDSDYYQDYSYVLESPIAVELFEKPVKENLHPTGLKFFARLTEGISIIDIGTVLTDIIHNIIQWGSLELVEQGIDNLENTIYQKSIAPLNADGADFDWRYFEQNRENVAFDRLFTLQELGSLPINHVENNYAENFLTVTVLGVPTTDYTILNELVVLDTPMASDGYVYITTTDEDIPIENREYRFYAVAGSTDFVLPTKINKMNDVAPSAIDFMFNETTREVATFEGSISGSLAAPIYYAGDFRVEIEFSTTYSLGSWNTLIGNDVWNTSLGWVSYVADGKIVFDKAGGGTVTSTTTISDGKKHKVKIEYISGTVYMFVDGVEEANLAIALVNAPHVNIGARHNNDGTGSTDKFNGQIFSIKLTDLDGVENVIADLILDSGSTLYELAEDESLGAEEVDITLGTPETGWTIDSSNEATFTGSVITSYVDPVTSPLISSKYYLLDFTISGHTGVGEVGFSSQGGVDPVAFRSSGNASISGVFLSDGDPLRIFSHSNVTNANVTVNSIKQLPDNTCLLESFTVDNWKPYTLKRNVVHDNGEVFSAWVGENRFINPNFDTDTDWTKNNATIAGGVATLPDNGSISTISQDISAIYLSILITADIRSIGATNLKLENLPSYPVVADSVGVHKIIEKMNNFNSLVFYRNVYTEQVEINSLTAQHFIEVAYR